MNQSFIQVRVDDELKQDATEVLEQMGIDMPNAIRMYLKRIVMERRIPFDVKLSNNDEIREKAETENGIIVIPAIKAEIVEFEEYLEVLKSVPQGKLTRDDDIMDYLKILHNAKRIEINHTVQKVNPIDIGIPLWRVVSSRGFLQRNNFFISMEKQQDLLEKEGFHIVRGGANGASLKVENYREYLFDFGKR